MGDWSMIVGRGVQNGKIAINLTCIGSVFSRQVICCLIVTGQGWLVVVIY